MLIVGIIVSIFAVLLIIFPKVFLKSKTAEAFILRRLSEHDSKKAVLAIRIWGIIGLIIGMALIIMLFG